MSELFRVLGLIVAVLAGVLVLALLAGWWLLASLDDDEKDDARLDHPSGITDADPRDDH